MDKREIYFTYAKLPREDGTFSDYFTYYMEHPQKNTNILIRACKEFSEYVHFCMEICVFYKSQKKNTYRQIVPEDDELDYSDYEINFIWDDMKIYKDTDLSTIDYPNIKGLIKMHSLNEGYRGILKRLLRGETFLDIK
jgi:hypothetical protein